MTTQLYKEGLALSKSYQTRTKEQDTELYSIIQFASNSILENENRALVDRSLQFLVLVFEPLIKKFASYYYSQVSSDEEYDDVLQEIYATFLTLIYKYNPERASFSYYINDMLPRHMCTWVQKTRLRHIIDNNGLEDEDVCDPYLKDESSVYTHFNSYILEKEYETFIKARAVKNVRSNTVPEVCYNYFLNKKTCSEIAHDLGISYQAVREVINKIKVELKEFLSDSIFTDYSLDELDKLID